MNNYVIRMISLFGLSAGVSIVVMVTVALLYKSYKAKKDRFVPSIEANIYYTEAKDSLTKWIESTTHRINKNNIRIKSKHYITLGVLSFSAAFVFSINVFNNLSASILFSLIFLMIPEYLLSLYEDNIERKIEEQLVNAIKLYTAEFMQRKPMQKIFATIATKIHDPVGKYFNDAYYDLITGHSTDVVLSKLTSKFSLSYGKMFIQFIKESQRDANVSDLFPEMLVKVEDHIELARSNKTNMAADRLQAFLISLLPIPAYFSMNKFFPETSIFIKETYYGRLIITLSFLSFFVFVILDRFIRKVE